MSLLCSICAVCVPTCSLAVVVAIGCCRSARPVIGQLASLRSARRPLPALAPLQRHRQHYSSSERRTPRTKCARPTTQKATQRTQSIQRQRIGSDPTHNRRLATSPPLPLPSAPSAALAIAHHDQSAPSSCTTRCDR